MIYVIKHKKSDIPSWNGYVPLGVRREIMEELKGTVDLMLSEDYKERFVAEFMQLKIRYERLRAMLDKWDEGQLNFEPTCPRELYDKQIEGMETYLDVLSDRAEIEGIELY